MTNCHSERSEESQKYTIIKIDISFAQYDILFILGKLFAFFTLLHQPK